jgi:diguanylate cyclase (GGDEF)-like protein/PAS domain S-box-containing protein
MKKFLNSIYFYPFIALISVVLGLFGLYFYNIHTAQKSIMQQQLQNAQESALLLKSMTEELSINKKKTLIQREVTRLATHKYARYVLLTDTKGRVLYASRHHYISKKIENIFGKRMAAHYINELHEDAAAHIHPYTQNKIDITLHLNYLYNNINDTVAPGYMILQYDISPLVISQTHRIQNRLFTLFALLALIIVLLSYLYYRYFFAKLYRVEQLSASLSGKEPKETPLLSIDNVIEHLLKTTTEFAVMSRVVQYSNDAILVTDADKKIITANPAFETLSGYKLNEIIGKKPEELIKSDLMDKTYYKNMWHEIEKNGLFEGQITDRRKDGTSYTVWQKISSLKDPNTKQVTNYVAMSQDISELLEKQKYIEHLAFHDGLTDLVNRSYFLHLMNKIIKTRKKKHFAILFADLDNFKEINDTFGHKAGDMVLLKFATYLQEKFREEDIIARLGGDEFAIMAMNIQEPETALDLGYKIIDFANNTLTIDHKKIDIGVSVGVAFYPFNGQNSTDLLTAADIAMYRSKQEGKNRCTLFEQQMQEEANKKVQLRHELKDAISNNELTLYYQPKYTVDGKTIVGFEGLIRWIHPKKGFIGPDMFIPIAEDSGLVVDMTNWIFQEINRVIPKFQAIYKQHFYIAINISAKHFNEERLINDITSNIYAELFKNGYIKLEVTESAVMDDVSLAQKQLETLNAMGIQISLDDYGTGHSSLSYLKHLPISTLKVDKSFVDGLCTDEKDYAIVKSTIELARSLGMKTVIEGVEHQEQLDKLQNMHADYIQGYIYSRPLKEEDVLELLKDVKA